MSLDVLRGFDMFWITGGGIFLVALATAIGYDPLTELVKRHTQHVVWDGLAAWDLIFPVFIFISGATMPFALTGRLERGDSRWALCGRVVRRALLLIALGLALGFFRFDFAEMRYVSVLGLIGMAYLVAGLIVLWSGPRGQAAWVAGIVLGHGLALAWIPVPGVGVGVMTPGGCLNGYVDSHVLPGQLYEGGVVDPVGPLCFLPAAATALMGALAGRRLRTHAESPYRNVFVLFGCGAMLLALGYASSPWCPIIKTLWSSSYVLVAGGWAIVLLAIFYLVIDVWRWRWLGFYFVPIGMNAITIYLALFYVNWHFTSDRVFGGLARLAGNQAGPVVAAAGVLAVQWVVLYFLYRRGIFLKV